MPIELEYIAIQINAMPAQITDINTKSKCVYEEHVRECSDCQEEEYSCYEVDETIPILRALCLEDCPGAGPDGDMCITERNIYINMFYTNFPSDWFMKATQLNPGVTITAHNFGFQEENAVAQFRDGLCTYIYVEPSDRSDINAQTYNRFLELVDDRYWFACTY